MNDAVQIGELLFEIGCNIHDLLPYFNKSGALKNRGYTSKLLAEKSLRILDNLPIIAYCA